MKVPRHMLDEFIRDLKSRSPVQLRYTVHSAPVKKVEYMIWENHVATYYIDSEESFIW